ncbi:hypothetical protein [Phytoactinopolyspora limicola]|uniref:hypothetical protein n=1 Tax=Phytoactinopolyspora limicola TaxID=2715536 RepID=UPI00140E57C7|nr:hypothetical protein [Phytoactinopolyspora limicola]
MTNSGTTDPDTLDGTFAEWLLTQSAGRTHEELSDGLRDLIARVKDTGKKGSIVLTVKVGLLDKNPDGPLVVNDEIKLNLPEHDRKASLYYADEHNNLSRNDPNQLTLDVRDTPEHHRDIRDPR